jgi:glycosyltransferase involved in cell wall biosynthesis
MTKKHCFLTRKGLSALRNAGSRKEISILLPAYNEALQIEKCIRAVEHAVSSLSKSYEIIVAEDGSTDGTDRVVASLTRKYPNLNLLHSSVRLGKGRAIKNAVGSAKGEVIVFMDVDLATSLGYLPRILQQVRQHGGIAIGSRHVKGSVVKRRISRTLFSLAYNLLVRMLFFDGIRDHQCGFKAMSREAAHVLREVKSDGFFFDTEMILRCKKLGFPVAEVGVEWAEKRRTRDSKVNLFQDAKRIGLDLLSFRLNDS